LNLKTALMVCNEICIPENIELSIRIPAGKGLASPHQKLIDRAKLNIPDEESGSLVIDTIVAGPDGLVISAQSQSGFEDADVFATVEEYAFTGLPEIMLDEKESRKALIKIPKPSTIEDINAFLDGKELHITMTAGDDAVTRKISF
jgi:suppressor for copper-sensitivity B